MTQEANKKPLPIPLKKALTEEEGDIARFDECTYYFQCLGRGVRFWRCSLDCPYYLAPEDRPQESLHRKSVDGEVRLMKELFPNYFIIKKKKKDMQRNKKGDQEAFKRFFDSSNG
ncbi:MAG: hypothetical protein HQL69_18910 [Magnetococcales bacterium]|nr:hypothetical protein [Magnetococcales bacterium]